MCPLSVNSGEGAAAAGLVGRREHRRLVHADRGPRSRRLEHLVPKLIERGAELDIALKMTTRRGAARWISDGRWGGVYGDYGGDRGDERRRGGRASGWGAGPSGSRSTSSAGTRPENRGPRGASMQEPADADGRSW